MPVDMPAPTTLSVLTSKQVPQYDANLNIIQLPLADPTQLADQAEQVPITNAALYPNVVAQGVPNKPLNAVTSPIGPVQITAGVTMLSVWSNPA